MNVENEVYCEFFVSETSYKNLYDKIFSRKDKNDFLQTTYYYKQSVRHRVEYDENHRLVGDDIWQLKSVTYKKTLTKVFQKENTLFFLPYVLKSATEKIIDPPECEEVIQCETVSICRYITFNSNNYKSKVLRLNLGKRNMKFGTMYASSSIMPVYYLCLEFEFDDVVNFKEDVNAYSADVNLFLNYVADMFDITEWKFLLNDVEHSPYNCLSPLIELFRSNKHRFVISKRNFLKECDDYVSIVPKWDGDRGYAYLDVNAKNLFILTTSGFISKRFEENFIIQNLLFQVEMMNNGDCVLVEVLKASSTFNDKNNYHNVAMKKAQLEFASQQNVDDNTKRFINIPISESLEFFNKLKNIDKCNGDDLRFTEYKKMRKDIFKINKFTIKTLIYSFHNVNPAQIDGFIFINSAKDVRYKYKYFDSIDCYFKINDLGDLEFYTEEKYKLECNPKLLVSKDVLNSVYENSFSLPVCELLLLKKNVIYLSRIRVDKYKVDTSNKILFLLKKNLYRTYTQTTHSKIEETISKSIVIVH